MHSRWERIQSEGGRRQRVPGEPTFCVQSGSSPGDNQFNQLLHPAREGDSLMLQTLLIGSQLHLFT